MKNRNNNDKRILILADFMEGNSTAINFAMNYLHDEQSSIYLLQTWKKPAYGAASVRDLAEVLKEITLKELKALKAHMLKNYSIRNPDVKLLSFEGELTDFFKSKIYANHNWQVVLSLKEQGLYTEKDAKIKEVKVAVHTPIYILNDYNPNEKLKSISIKNGSSQPSTSFLYFLSKICSQQNCNVLVEINDNDFSNYEKKSLIKKYLAACGESSLQFEQMGDVQQLNNSQPKPILSIYHKHHIKHKVGDLVSYFDNLLFRLKRTVV
ncbi:hypothetical protein [Marinifilum sp.]|uniref:hypothetical protein n=1 Tax=Marinifilum sp. TaxID=2033137 RepID=UPI003BA91509